MTKRVLVLDLDETLVRSTEEQPETYDFLIDASDPWYVKIRPHLDVFLDIAFRFYHVGIWTAGNEAYAEFVVNKLFTAEQKDKLLFVWDGSYCDDYDGGDGYVKDLSKLAESINVDLDQILILDDNPNPQMDHNIHVQITQYLGEKEDDDALIHAGWYFHYLTFADSVRDIDHSIFARMIGV